MATIILLLLLLTIVAVFSVQNATPVIISLFFWQFEASLAIVIFLSVLCGMIAGSIIISLIKFKQPVKKENKPL
jgi:uncharacterized integral membrane protein